MEAIFFTLFFFGGFSLVSSIANLTEEVPQLQVAQNITSLKFFEVHWDHVKVYYVIAFWILAICLLRSGE